MFVLQGLIDISAQPVLYTKALKSVGVDSQTWLYQVRKKYKENYKNLDFSNKGFLNGRARRLTYLLEAFQKFDVWHLHKGISFFYDGQDLKFARKKGIKIIIHYRGREIRPHIGIKELPNNILNKVRKHIESANNVIVHDGELARLIEPVYPKVSVFPNVVEIPKVSLKQKTPNRKLRVIHIPSCPKYKGTNIIADELDKLKNTIDYKILSNIPHRQVFFEISKADVIVDQVLTGTYGNITLECMALGKCAIARIEDDFIKYEPEIPPVINCNDSTISQEILKISNDREILYEIGKKGREFVAKYHSVDSVGRQLKRIYDEA